MAYQKYPYTDLHELNLDWILAEMKALDKKIDDIVDTITAEVTKEAIAYIDMQVASMKEDIAQLYRDFDAVERDFHGLEDDIAAFKTYINLRISYIEQTIDQRIDGVNARTDVLIQSNNEYLLSQMVTYLNQIKVINYFTGEMVTIQDMFNYLAGLHLNDSIDYDTMAARSKTYTELAGLNINYTNLAMHGNTLYV